MEHLKPSTINKKGVPPKSPILKNMASGKKTNRGKIVTKKTSPKREKSELKLLFEKIRKKKEREAEKNNF